MQAESTHDALEAGRFCAFSDWPNPDVPRVPAGVYNIWRNDEFVYAGISGDRGPLSRPTAAQDRGENESTGDMASRRGPTISAGATGRRIGSN